MKIAINCIFCQPRGGGIKEYIYNIVNALSVLDHENEYVLYVLKDNLQFAEKMLPHTGSFRIKTLPYTGSYLDVIKRSLFSNAFWTKEEAIEKFDIFHSPFFHCPKLRHAKVVITVHDLRFYRYPSTYAFLRYVFLRFAVKRSIYRCDHIISISSFTKEEIMAAYKVPSDKITVVLEAINREDFNEKLIELYTVEDNANQLINAPFILSVGHIEPRKNYERLLDAFSIIKQRPEAANLKLVIVGKKGHHFKSVVSRMENTKDVVYLNFVTRELLLWLYKNASVFAFPTFYEGFGFPPLEAACLGTISSVAHISSMPEVCGDSVDYCDPFNVNDIAESLSRCLYDEKTKMHLEDKLESNLNRFSWSKNAEMTMQVYKSLF